VDAPDCGDLIESGEPSEEVAEPLLDGDLVESSAETWPEAYAASARWGAMWTAMQATEGEWPEGARIHMERLVWHGKVAVPESKVFSVLKDYHAHVGHVGVRKMVEMVGRSYVFPPRCYCSRRPVVCGPDVPCVRRVNPQIGACRCQCLSLPFLSTLWRAFVWISSRYLP
jgi:hypothetical protein